MNLLAARGQVVCPSQHKKNILNKRRMQLMLHNYLQGLNAYWKKTKPDSYWLVGATVGGATEVLDVSSVCQLLAYPPAGVFIQVGAVSVWLRGMQSAKAWTHMCARVFYLTFLSVEAAIFDGVENILIALDHTNCMWAINCMRWILCSAVRYPVFEINFFISQIRMDMIVVSSNRSYAEVQLHPVHMRKYISEMIWNVNIKKGFKFSPRMSAKVHTCVYRALCAGMLMNRVSLDAVLCMLAAAFPGDIFTVQAASWALGRWWDLLLLSWRKE